MTGSQESSDATGLTRTVTRDPAASMSLLTGLVADAVRSDYPPHDPERARTQERRSRSARLLTLASLLAVGGLLATAAVMTRAAAPTTEAQRAQLVERVRHDEARAEDLDEAVARATAEVDALESAALEGSAAGQAAAARLAAAEAAAGYSAASGPGVAVELDDAERGGRGPAADLGRVIDRDLQTAVNGLWRSGATSVAVNGVRLTARTAIRSAGQAILVDYRPLARPYRIEAIGPMPSMGESFASGEAGRALRGLAATYGIQWSMSDAADLRLPAGTSTLPETARPLEEDHA